MVEFEQPDRVVQFDAAAILSTDTSSLPAAFLDMVERARGEVALFGRDLGSLVTYLWKALTYIYIDGTTKQQIKKQLVIKRLVIILNNTLDRIMIRHNIRDRDTPQNKLLSPS